tara:strand:+ start:5982 stop:6614 length:633 start_codon:yes stop_codon:yes gene_type:complete
MAVGSNRIAVGWTLAVICWIFAIAMLIVPTDSGNGIDSDGDGVDDNCDEDPFDDFWSDNTCDDTAGAIGGFGCCCLVGFAFLGLVDSGKKARTAAQTQVIYIPQQQPVQQVVHQTYIQQQTPVVQQQIVPAAPIAPTKSSAHWAMEARNFEVALNWDKAADSYEKAGLFEEAGRVRKVQMEKSGAGVNIHVKSGDTYHDSVVMKDDDTQL